MGVASFLIFIYLAAGFENGKGLGELLSPFNLFGFLFWLYVGFLVILFFAMPNQKQCQEIKKELERKEGKFKALCFKDYNRARRIANQWAKNPTPENFTYKRWFEEIDGQDQVLRDWTNGIYKAKKGIPEYRKRIRMAEEAIKSRQKMGKGEDDEKIKECRETIAKNERYIKEDEGTIRRNTEKLKNLGWDENRQPIGMTWEEVEDFIRKERSVFCIRKIKDDEE